MPKGYHRLTHTQRSQIQILKKTGKSQTQIAILLGVNRSTICRELRNNTGKSGYQAKEAELLSRARRQQAGQRPRKMTPERVALVESLIKKQWSPEQIAGRLNLEHPEDYVSHETIYKHVWADKKKGGQLYLNLRHHGKKYRKSRAAGAGKKLIPNRVDIDKRPPIVESKERLGDWELDTIIGALGEHVIVSMVERSTKMTKLAVAKNKSAKAVSRAIIKTLKPLSDYVKTLTSDNGREFAYHEFISGQLEADFYFAKPYHSWERGLNEHTNGLVRQYLPKRTAFDFLKPKHLLAIEHRLNNRPRKVLNHATPQEAFNIMKGRPVALRH